MIWQDWMQGKKAENILEAQVPHNITYWIRKNCTCANKKCPHRPKKPIQLVWDCVQHYGHGYCFDCYHDLGIGSGIKKPGSNHRGRL